ncbi:MAG: hypothetical protein A2W90_18415 [Bacteroidetes bacterium GWF2_42_66]|nr:MAG: hypothetical protein A2W92_11500 [Bacteroidetes bacterium GWA2_42_15]OFX98226.1 MAG: hypothetical protein A2W89_09915 [Bacteroidetes bacterium GWE2_42_39]OFY42609.1 MAG: hypothetical protein A2W90_18415 [Bacteroidetes bacterium GWF2_42_66]HAZ03020.1 hypothetical protein [Marinilabiliales bacterium]HBL74330.1 hypothetical protein [Prolixibacteraceae bacterium]
MDTPNLTFNILTFSHPKEEYTFWFTDRKEENLSRIHHSLVPEEVIIHFGNKEHYFTSFDKQHDGFFPVTKKSNSPRLTEHDKMQGINKNQAFARSLLRRYYNVIIHSWFQNKKLLVKPTFINDVDIWLPLKKADNQYWFFEKFTIKVQFTRITEKPELLVSYAGSSKIFKTSIVELIPQVSPVCFNWVVYKRKLVKYGEMPEEAKQNLDKVYPVWNFVLRDALNQETEATDKTNRYIKYQNKINNFFNSHLNTFEFKEIIPVESKKFIPVPPVNINRVNDSSNQLLFANKKLDVVPYNGMKYGPYRTSEYSKIQFFYIFHAEDTDIAKILNNYLGKGIDSFKGLYNFAKVPYFTEPNFSISFTDKYNPLPEITKKIRTRNFRPDVHYMAIYVSPHNKHVRDRVCKSIYYRIKEILLKKGITSQAIDANKVRAVVQGRLRYDYSLNNISIAILAKLDGIPWQLNAKLKNELILGVGAFRNLDTNVQYIGSAFSFMNNGRFKHFECFRKNQIDELAGSIIHQIKEYVSVNSNISRLIIHFYKNMSHKELKPIEDGLNGLGLDIPVFILSINKTESNDIVAFDNGWKDLMPQSGIFINLGGNSFLLFNNTRYSNNRAFNTNDGYPFPIKLNIKCTHEELAKDYKTIRELIDQVYQFSRMYWKSVRQQNLPVTIRYPEMVAEIYPHFDGYEIPAFGKDNLWFL